MLLRVKDYQNNPISSETPQVVYQSPDGDLLVALSPDNIADIIADLAKEAKQDIANSALASILAELVAIKANTDSNVISVDNIDMTSATISTDVDDLEELTASQSNNQFYERILSADDAVITYTWLDQGTTDERIGTISGTATLTVGGLPVTKTFTDTYQYNGSAPYSLQTKTRVIT